MLQNVKPVSCFLFLILPVSFCSLAGTSPTTCPPKTPWHFFHQYFGKSSGKELRLTPWPLLLSWTLVLSDPTFRVFSVSLKFAVVPDRHQSKPSGLLTRCRQHCIHIGHSILNVETPRPSPFSLRGPFMSVFTLYSRKTQRGLCVKRDQPSHIWNAPTICLHQAVGGGPTGPGNVPHATRARCRLCPGDMLSCPPLPPQPHSTGLMEICPLMPETSFLSSCSPGLVWTWDVTPDHSGSWVPGCSYTCTQSPHPTTSPVSSWAWACPHWTAKWPV